MNIRAKIFGSSKPEEPIVRDKQPKGAKTDELHSVSVSREEPRRGNSRTGDRHRLSHETVKVVHDGIVHEAELINLSGGGAMIRSGFDVKLWDPIELHLGENGTVECAVRWIRGDRVGVEFAHETRLDCSSDDLSHVLRSVIARSFPEAGFDQVEAAPKPSARAEEHRRDARHPLIWSGTLHLDSQSTTVRVRNISSTGAMIECAAPVRVGAETVLDLNPDASISATVQWAVGDQLGLRFHRTFDMRLLGRSKPEVTPAKWVRPAYLAPTAATAADPYSPWDPRWKRLSLRELGEELEGFLKR